MDVDKPEDMAICCSILVEFFGLLRKKNFVPEDILDLDTTKILTAGNFAIDGDRGIAFVYFPFSSPEPGQALIVLLFPTKPSGTRSLSLTGHSKPG